MTVRGRSRVRCPLRAVVPRGFPLDRARMGPVHLLIRSSVEVGHWGVTQAAGRVTRAAVGRWRLLGLLYFVAIQQDPGLGVKPWSGSSSNGCWAVVTRRRWPLCLLSAPALLTSSGTERRQPSRSRRSMGADSVTPFGGASRPPAWRGPCNASTCTVDQYDWVRSGRLTERGSSCCFSTRTAARWWRAPESGKPNRAHHDRTPAEALHRQHAFQLWWCAPGSRMGPFTCVHGRSAVEAATVFGPV